MNVKIDYQVSNIIEYERMPGLLLTAFSKMGFIKFP